MREIIEGNEVLAGWVRKRLAGRWTVTRKRRRKELQYMGPTPYLGNQFGGANLVRGNK